MESGRQSGERITSEYFNQKFLIMEITIKKLYLIRTKFIQDDRQESDMIKSLEVIFPEDLKSKVATLELDDQEIFVPFLSEIDSNQLIHTFKTLGILLGVEDITERILMGEAMTVELSKLFSENKFELLRRQYISENITKDIILDKIGSKGIGSLTEADRKVLSAT